MSKDTYLPRMGYIIKKLEKGPASFEQIFTYLEDQSEIVGKEFTISQRTLQRDIRFLADMGFEILNEKKGDKRYYIKSRSENLGYTERMLEAYEMMNMVELSDQNKQHIFFETRKPKGLENFNGLLHAIKSKKITNFIHHKYWEDIITYRTVHPLALKEARGRWYLLAVDEKDNRLKSFGLDRINDLDISKAKYRTKYDYNFNEMFNHSFGIISDEKIKIQAVRINLAFEQGQFVKNFPLHHSQKIISETNTEVLIQLHIRPTYDFIMEILSMGEEVTILSPQTLINEVKRITKKVYEKYV